MSIPQPQIVLCIQDPNTGIPPLPSSVTMPDGSIASIWNEKWPAKLGNYEGIEYRNSALGNLVCVFPIALCTLPNGFPGALCVCFVPVELYEGSNETFVRMSQFLMSQDLIAKVWGCSRDPNTGAMLASDLINDNSEAAIVAKSVWPKDWHVRLSTDDNGEFDHATMTEIRPPALPTGPMCLGIILE
jgi:hypothetical protein